jgi:hypothetical protein
MTIFLAENFEYFPLGWDNDYSLGRSLTIHHGGIYSAYVNTGGNSTGQAWANKTFPTTVGDFHVQCWVYVPDTTTDDNDVMLIELINTILASIKYHDSTYWLRHNNGSTIQDIGVLIPNTWHQIDAYYKYATGKIHYYIDNVQQGTDFTGYQGAHKTSNVLYIGDVSTNPDATNGNIYIDDYLIDDAAEFFTRISQGTNGYARGTSTSSTITVTLQQIPVSKDVLIATIGIANSSAIVVRIDDANGKVVWTKQIGNSQSSGDAEIWLGVVSSGASVTQTVTLTSGSADGAVTDICEYAGILIITSPLDKTALDNNSSSNPDTGTTDPTTQNHELWIGVTVTYTVSGTQTIPTNGFTLLDGTLYTHCSVAYLEKPVLSIGTAGSGTTDSASDPWVGCIATFKILLQPDPNSLIANILQSISLINWLPSSPYSHSIYIKYTGALLGIYGASDFASEIVYENNLNTLDGFNNASMLRKMADMLGLSSTAIDTATKATLDSFPFFPNLHLPMNYSSMGTNQADSILAYRYACMNLYKVAKSLNYNTTKWNGNLAWQEMKTIMDITGMPCKLNYFANGTTSHSGNRFYDENAEWMEFFIDMYEMDPINNIGALVYARDTIWVYDNLAHWYTTHYIYSPSYPNYECEGAFFHLIFGKIMADNGYSLTNWDRVLTDIKSRYLDEGWLSPQWSTSIPASSSIYCVVHHNPNNPQHRLQNTVGAIFSLQAFYQILDATSQSNWIGMLNGTTPAWQLMELYSGLFNSWRWGLSGEPYYDGATVYALPMLFLLGIVPSTASLYSPLYEYVYECWMNFDNDWAFDYKNNRIVIPVFSGVNGNGSMTFIYGSTPVTQVFSNDGVWELIFSNDWNSILSATWLRNLDPTKTYVRELGAPPIQRTTTVTFLTARRES